MKRKTKPSGAMRPCTAILRADGDLEVMGGSMADVREYAKGLPGTRAVLLVEANPRTDAVVKAARLLMRPPDQRRTYTERLTALLFAVEALDAKKPKK